MTHQKYFQARTAEDEAMRKHKQSPLTICGCIDTLSDLLNVIPKEQIKFSGFTIVESESMPEGKGMITDGHGDVIIFELIKKDGKVSFNMTVSCT